MVNESLFWRGKLSAESGCRFARQNSVFDQFAKTWTSCFFFLLHFAEFRGVRLFVSRAGRSTSSTRPASAYSANLLIDFLSEPFGLSKVHWVEQSIAMPLGYNCWKIVLGVAGQKFNASP